MPAKVSSPESITQMLRAWSEDRRGAALDSLIPIVYDELRRLAHRRLRRERGGHSLQTSGLVNETYLKLIEQRNVSWQSRAHFYAIAANLMRRILIDYAKTKYRQKRGGRQDDLPLDEALTIAVQNAKQIDLLALDEALNRLAALDEQAAKIVELRYFADLTIEETSEVLSISPATVKRDWQMAKAWLHHELSKQPKL